MAWLIMTATIAISSSGANEYVEVPDISDTLPLQRMVDSTYSVIRQAEESNRGSITAEQLVKKAEAFMGLGKSFYQEGLYTNSFNAYTNALQLAEEHRLTALLPRIYNGIGSIYCTWSDYATGLIYYKKGIEQCSQQRDVETYRSLLINIQGAYIILEDIKDAKIYYKKMCAMKAQNGLTRYFKESNQGLFLLSEGKIEPSITYFRKSGAIGKQIDASLYATSLDYIGDAYSKTMPDSALKYWEDALAVKGIAPIMRLSVLKKLANINKRLQRHDKSAYYGNEYMMLSDSIFKLSEINRIRDIHAAYENNKKLRQIESLSIEKKAQSIQIRHQRRAIFLIIIVLVIVMTMTIVLMRQKRKLRQTYIHLFHSHKETLATQSENERREEDLRQEISRLRAGLEEKEPQAARQPQSVDKLSEEKRKEILESVEKVLRDEDMICDPDFSIQVLAEATGVNSRYLSQVINDTYGCNFRTKLNECRMTIAQRRILDVKHYGNLTIQAIAESVGYRSQSGFVQLFKKATGFTPSMFQKMAREEM